MIKLLAFLSLALLFTLPQPSGEQGSRNPYPDELSGFKFYARYLSPLQPMKSMRPQVIKVLGSDDVVEVGPWRISPRFRVETEPTDSGHSAVHIDRLASVIFTPTQRVPMIGTRFPATFVHHVSEISEPSGGVFDVYEDRWGLAYWLYSGKSTTGENGDLRQIEYGPAR
jgi:hypothetical protein